jgi:hypothetical protein
MTQGKYGTQSTWIGRSEVDNVPYFPEGAASRVRAMTKWEYLTAPILTHAAKQILDNFGADGWELVQVAPGMNPENLVGYFKRPLEG